jgi:hypothetical protein
MSEFYDEFSDHDCEQPRPRILNLQQFATTEFDSCDTLRNKCVIVYYGKSLEYIKKREHYKPNVIWVRAEQSEAVYDCLLRARKENGNNYVLIVDTSFPSLKTIASSWSE